MKWNSVRTKVLAALLACLVVGVGGILALMRYSFERNSQAMAEESVAGAQKLFTILGRLGCSKSVQIARLHRRSSPGSPICSLRQPRG